MRLLLFATLAFTVGLIAGCPSMGTVVPQTTDQKIAVAYITTKGVLDGTLVLLKAKKISPDDAENVLSQAKNVHTGLQVATSLLLVDVTAASNKLEAQLAILNALEAYLSSKQGGVK